MLSDLSFAQEGHRPCGEKRIFLQDNKEVPALTKNKTSWPLSVVFRPQSYRKFVEIDCWKSLWKSSTIPSNFWAKKCNLRRMGKVASIQTLKLVDSMPNRYFEVIKAKGVSTKY